MRDRSENKVSFEIRLLLIRHGATKSNLEHRYLGRTDEALSDIGIRDLRDRREEGSYPSPEKLFVSPMLRCRQTAGIIFPEKKYEVISEWREIDFGIFEGKNHIELSGNCEYRDWVSSNGTLPFPKGEGREEYAAFVMRGFDKMATCLRRDATAVAEAARGISESWEVPVQEKEESVSEIAAVVHGGTIMALCSSLFGGEYFDYQIGCGEGYECRFRYMEDQTAKLLEIRRI